MSPSCARGDHRGRMWQSSKDTRAKIRAATGRSQPGRNRPCGGVQHGPGAVRKLFGGRRLGRSARQQCRETNADTHVVTAFAPRIRGCAPARKSRGDITVFMRTKPGRKDVARSGQRRIKTSYTTAWKNVQGLRISESRAGEAMMRSGCLPGEARLSFIAFAPRAPSQRPATGRKSRRLAALRTPAKTLSAADVFIHCPPATS